MRRATLVSALAALLLAACDGPAEFAMPLSPPGTAPHDERLIGYWYSQFPEVNGIITLAVAPRADGLLDVAFGYMVVEPGEERYANFAWTMSTVHASLIGDQTYYNARVADGGMMSKDSDQPAVAESDPVLSPHPDRGYLIARADIDDSGILWVQLLSEALPSERNLPSHALDCGAHCSITVYDLEPAALAELIASGPDADLFALRAPFARFGAPPPPIPE